jgi:hypothetical protein
MKTQRQSKNKTNRTKHKDKAKTKPTDENTKAKQKQNQQKKTQRQSKNKTNITKHKGEQKRKPTEQERGQCKRSQPEEGLAYQASHTKPVVECLFLYSLIDISANICLTRQCLTIQIPVKDLTAPMEGNVLKWITAQQCVTAEVHGLVVTATVRLYVLNILRI